MGGMSSYCSIIIHSCCSTCISLPILALIYRYPRITFTAVTAQKKSFFEFLFRRSIFGLLHIILWLPEITLLTAMSIPIILFLLSSFITFHPVLVEPAKSINPQIIVMGIVYCDICSNNSFSRHSYFLPGVQVKVDCMFKANSPRTTEEIEFSVNRTTNRYGIYKLEIPSVDGIECAREKAVGNSCRASLISSSSAACNVPGSRTTSDEIAIKSQKANTCIYSLGLLNYRPSRRSTALCGN